MSNRKKTIYVREEAEEIFDKAQQITGESLSRTIEIALRKYANDPKESVLDLANDLEVKAGLLRNRIIQEEVKDE